MPGHKKTNFTNVECCKCGKKNLNSKIALRERKRGDWTGNWLCKSCYSKDYEKNNPNSRNNLIKSLYDSRTRNLDPNSNKAKGDVSQLITCRNFNVKDLNIENDNFHTPIDHSEHPLLGILQSKGSTLLMRYIGSIKYEYWSFCIINEVDKNFDYLVVYCFSDDRKNIERVYIIPQEEIIKRSSFIIYNNDHSHWYDKYRTDEKSYNKIYHNINELIKR